MHTITLHPQQSSFSTHGGQSLLDALLANGQAVSSPCNQQGTCGKCKVRILSGLVPPPTPEELQLLGAEELARNVRLSCQLYPAGDLTIALPQPADAEHRILNGGQSADVELQPAIRKVVFPIPAPAQPQRSCLDALAGIVDISDLADSPEFLRGAGALLREGTLTATYAQDRLLGLESGDTTGQTYGLAVDIGTTTVVASLLNLETGAEVDHAAALNPQSAHGQDVLTRISFAQKADQGLEILQRAIADGLNAIIRTLCVRNGVDAEHIYELTIAANATMLHLLLGVDPSSMGRAPYLPVFTRALHPKAADLGLRVSPFARVYCLPGVSAYVGADIVAGAALCRLQSTEENILFIDIGTNGEIVLSRKGTLYACSCAAGPALEGMNISCGMLAGTGAIENVRFAAQGDSPDVALDVTLDVIGGGSPLGLCGSGIIDAVSELVRTGLVGKTGRLKKQEDAQATDGLEMLARRIEETDRKRRFVLDGANRIAISQTDIRQVQLAKGAILSGIRALLNALEMRVEDLDRIIVSGQFGSYLRAESLAGIGLIPAELQEKVEYVGNTSHSGAIQCLLSVPGRREVEAIAGQIRYLELNSLADYEKLFSQCLGF